MSSIINGFILFSLIITALYFIGLVTQITEHEKNQCEMTYMYEYPQFVKISNSVDEKYPKYGLYAYSEGRITERARNMYFDGIPILFIPGNAGSHRQGRSFSSIALRKSIHSRTPFHFDHFAVDLNEELSGLNGALLYDQLAYVNASIYRILSLYKNRKNPPKSVVLIGHSMGGVIARRIVADLPENSDLIPLVLTLASPHSRPPLVLDTYTHNFYKKIEPNASTTLTTFISLTGGHRDFLVPSYLTQTSAKNSLDVVTTQIPRSWLGVDHVCILWCKQTVLALNRALFDIVDAKTKQISTDPALRKAVFYHHTVQHSGIKSKLLNNYKTLKANINNQGEWVENLARQYTISVPTYSSKPHFYMIRLVDQPQHEAVTIIGLNLDVVDWVFACGAHTPRGNYRVCEEFKHLTHLSEIAPSAFFKRRSITLNLHDLMKNDSTLTHVVLRVPPTDNAVMFNVDVYNIADRKRVVALPNIINFKRQVLIEETPEKAVHFELELSNLYHMIQSYQLFVDSVSCSSDVRHATASLIVPWGYQNIHNFFLNHDVKPFDIRLYTTKPHGLNQSATIKLTLDPGCRYRISVRSWFPGFLSNMSRLYTPFLVVNMAAVILMVLTTQLKSMDKERTCSLFFVALTEGAKPYYILTSVKLISRALSAKPLSNIFPTPDWLTMSQEGTDFFLLPLLLYICSVGLVWILGLVLCWSLVCFETTVHKFTLKFLARTVSFTVSWSDHVMSALHKLPFVVALALVFLTVTTTGALALCVGVVFYFLRLTQMSQDYIEDLVWFYIRKFTGKFKKAKPEPKRNEVKEIQKGEDKGNNNNDGGGSSQDFIFFHATLFMLWSVVAAINVPSVLTWAHNFKYNTVLSPDPAFIPGLVLSLCALPLWQMELPKMERRFYNELSQLISVLAVVSLICAPISVFRLNYTIVVTVAVVTLHQLLAPNRSPIEANASQSVPSFYEAMKAKLE